MSDENIKRQANLTDIKLLSILIFCGGGILMVWLLMPRLDTPQEQTPLVTCRINMKQLGLALQMYAEDSSGTYPTPEKWCDLIKPYLEPETDDIFVCPSAKDANCTYAINPTCSPDSPTDTVLLFETKGGWNLSGGPELLTTENHRGLCHVLLNNGRVERIHKPEQITALNWNRDGK